MISLVLIVLGSVTSLDIKSRVSDTGKLSHLLKALVQENTTQHLEFGTDAPVGYTPGTHPEVIKIHEALDLVDQRIFSSMVQVQGDEKKEKAEIHTNNANTKEGLANDTRAALEALEEAQRLEGIAKQAHDDAVIVHNEKIGIFNEKKGIHETKIAETETARLNFVAAGDREVEGKKVANAKLVNDLAAINTAVKGHFHRMCQEVTLINEIRILVGRLNPEYEHPGKNVYSDECKLCSDNGPTSTECESSSFVKP